MTKLNEQTITELAECIENGMTNADACAVAGVAPTTFYRWVREQSNDQEKALVAALAKAKAARKLKLLEAIDNAAANGSWQAAAWYLERAYPAEFARPDRYRDQGTAEAVQAVRELTASIKAQAAQVEAVA